MSVAAPPPLTDVSLSLQVSLVGAVRGGAREGPRLGLHQPAQRAGALPAAPSQEGRGEVSARQGGADPQGGDERHPETVLQVSAGSIFKIEEKNILNYMSKCKVM